MEAWLKVSQGGDSTGLTWNNRDRAALNAVARKAWQFKGNIEVNEQLVVLANDRETGLCNGDVITVTQCLEQRDVSGLVPGLQYLYHLEVDTAYDKDLPVWVILNLEGYSKAKAVVDAELLDDRPLVCDYGYCLTAHKSQGSEWNTVGIYAPDYMAKVMGEEETRRWLYTAITRAREKVRFFGGAWLAYALGG
jgi:exodeoxyribonuclease-5